MELTYGGGRDLGIDDDLLEDFFGEIIKIEMTIGTAIELAQERGDDEAVVRLKAEYDFAADLVHTVWVMGDRKVNWRPWDDQSSSSDVAADAFPSDSSDEPSGIEVNDIQVLTGQPRFSMDRLPQEQALDPIKALQEDLDREEHQIATLLAELGIQRDPGFIRIRAPAEKKLLVNEAQRRGVTLSELIRQILRKFIKDKKF